MDENNKLVSVELPPPLPEPSDEAVAEGHTHLLESEDES